MVNSLCKQSLGKPRDSKTLEFLGLQSHVPQGLNKKTKHISEGKAF